MKPTDTEPLCLISFEITCILLGGGPETRPGFWKAYRREWDLNQKTQYKNYHVQLCSEHLVSLKINLTDPVYYRNGRITSEKEVEALRARKAIPHASLPSA